MTLPYVPTNLCFKLVFENTTTGCNSRCLFLFHLVRSRVLRLDTRGLHEAVYDN
jgi:hypothetical protein